MLRFTFPKLIILTPLILCGFAVWVLADFVPPTAYPPEGNIPPPLHTGNITQVKKGPLGIQITNSALVIPENVSLYTDSAVGIAHASYTGVNSNWSMNSSQYALDTNAPISVYGLFSTGPIRSESAIVAPELKIQSLKVEGATGDTNRQLCGSTSDGALVPCTSAVGTQLQVSISVSPASVIPDAATPVTVSWQATADAVSCTALQGDGFSTQGEIWGTDKATAVKLADTETSQYVVACTDSYGNTRFASTQVTAARMSPEITFSITPQVGGWKSGVFFTTGFSVDPNGGGAVSCKKKVEGAAISPTNGWSGQKSGQWSSPISIPPGNNQSVNTCFSGCQFKDIVTEPNQSALLTVQCSNAGATTTESKWISVGK
jgi:hypothetical protein